MSARGKARKIGKVSFGWSAPQRAALVKASGVRAANGPPVTVPAGLAFPLGLGEFRRACLISDGAPVRIANDERRGK